MKTITLLAVLFASSAFAAPVFTDADVNEAIENQRRFREGMSKNQATDYISSAPSIEASKPMKVDYTIVTLPDGKTATALTFK
jgi:hypothetical protein